VNVSTDIDTIDIEEQAAAFKALADPTRLRVLRILEGGEHCVCEIQSHFEAIPQNLLSHHLRVLKEAGLVSAEKRGRWVYYQLNRPRLKELRTAIPSGRGKKKGLCSCRVGPAGRPVEGGR